MAFKEILPIFKPKVTAKVEHERMCFLIMKFHSFAGQNTKSHWSQSPPLERFVIPQTEYFSSHTITINQLVKRHSGNQIMKCTTFCVAFLNLLDTD